NPPDTDAIPSVGMTPPTHRLGVGMDCHQPHRLHCRGDGWVEIELQEPTLTRIFIALVPAPSIGARLPASTPHDGKRDERLWGDCREAEGSRPGPLGQAHGVEKGRPTLLS